MNRTLNAVCGVLLTGALLHLAGGRAEAQSEQPARPTLTFEGDTALFSLAIKPDKANDFEQIMGRVREALAKSDKPERQRQAQGWKVLRMRQALDDGSVVYVHMVHPVVPGAEYGVLPILYEAFPDERQALYELYRGALAKNLSLAMGSVAVDLTKP
ncbi:MAG: hypothetical protein AB7N65_11110 [Vicinamibacterales bacterium]